jgi:hypothetical protein
MITFHFIREAKLGLTHPRTRRLAKFSEPSRPFAYFAVQTMPDSSSFYLFVIGAGPGGYVCAFRAAQLGLKGRPHRPAR